MKFKRTASVLLALMLTFCISVPQALASQNKEETVYALLNSDGSVDQIYVVNKLIGEFTDYGSYSEIKNLSTNSVPEIDGDKITFPDENVEGGLYYQGTMQGELPFEFEFIYFLDGVKIEAEELAGASGKLELRIKCMVNADCNERVREGYMAQISLAFDPNDADNIISNEATAVAAGKTMNISYIVLPGKSAEYTLKADIKDFEMDGISIALLKGTVSGMDETVSETEKGFDEMLSGAEDMVDGTYELKDGMTSLTDGMRSLSSGMSKLSASGDDMLAGMEQYASGLNDYVNGVSDIASGSSGVKDGLDALAENAAAATGGITDINNGLRGLSSSSADLEALAQSLLSSPDPSVQALAQGTLQTLDSVGDFAAGLNEASAGLSEFASGVQASAAGYHEFDAGLLELSANGQHITAGYKDITGGFKSYLAGIKSSKNGVRKIYNSVKGLPDDIQELIDGQLEFKDGISTAKDEITENFIADDSPAVSFASPDKNHPGSVQYILKTPSITIKKAAEEEQEEEENESFFTRLADLFR